MNITSLLITFAGIIIIIALFIMSRITRNKIPTKKSSVIPDIKDENGEKFTSVLDDIPARDGSTPIVEEIIEEIVPQDVPVQEAELIEEKEEVYTPPKALETTQHILFISGNDQTGLDGDLVLKSLRSKTLVLGEMDIYHYMVNLENEPGMTSLFRVANGTEPWTLLDEDLIGKKLAGLSIVLLTPTRINDEKAMKTFISVSEDLCRAVNGTLKNDKQQPLTLDNKENLIASIKK